MSAANDRLLAAHEAGDAAQLATLYTHAADAADTEDESAFLLTFAYVFALEAGLPEAADLKARLVAMGRDT